MLINRQTSTLTVTITVFEITGKYVPFRINKTSRQRRSNIPLSKIIVDQLGTIFALNFEKANIRSYLFLTIIFTTKCIRWSMGKLPKIRCQLIVPLNNKHFMQTKDVFPRGTRNVPQITVLNVEKLNQLGFITVSSIALDVKYRSYSITGKPHSN